MLVTNQRVRNHLRVCDNEDVFVYIAAGELMAQEFLNRRVYFDQDDMTAALTQVPASLAQARQDFDAAVEAAKLIDDSVSRCIAMEAAQQSYCRAQREATMVIHGIVVNEAIQAGILLIIGHLYANREDVVVGASVAQMPMGAEYVLMPYRVRMGV